MFFWNIFLENIFGEIFWIDFLTNFWNDFFRIFWRIFLENNFAEYLLRDEGEERSEGERKNLRNIFWKK